MSQPERQSSADDSTVPDVIGKNVTQATSAITGAGLTAAYKGKDNRPITDPIASWYVQPNGESPPAGRTLGSGATVTLTIAATNTGRD
jgi:beta-lactam-binding protein with PASTA domain